MEICYWCERITQESLVMSDDRQLVHKTCSASAGIGKAFGTIYSPSEFQYHEKMLKIFINNLTSAKIL